MKQEKITNPSDPYPQLLCYVLKDEATYLEKIKTVDNFKRNFLTQLSFNLVESTINLIRIAEDHWIGSEAALLTAASKVLYDIVAIDRFLTQFWLWNEKLEPLNCRINFFFTTSIEQLNLGIVLNYLPDLLSFTKQLSSTPSLEESVILEHREVCQILYREILYSFPPFALRTRIITSAPRPKSWGLLDHGEKRF